MIERAQKFQPTVNEDPTRLQGPGIDQIAWTNLYLGMRKRGLYVASSGRLPFAESAEDVYQEGVISLFKARDRLTPESNIGGLLNRTIQNRRSDAERRRKGLRGNRPDILPFDTTDPQHNSLSPQPSFESDVDLRLVVEQALAQLPPEQKRAVELVHLQGCSVSEAAEILGVSEGTIKSRCSVGRRKLRGIISPQDLA